jgi:hypothetical protein
LPGSSAGWVGTPGWIYVENPLMVDIWIQNLC